MKKTDWTDRMLAALVELYPVETTAYTAAVLNLSESTVKLKARELGLVKMAKSRWMERADYIRNHFQECSFSEIGKALGITRMSVGRIAATLGLKRSSEEKHLISSRIRTQMVKRERRRIVFGLEPITGIRVISNRAKVRVRSNMKSNGYIISEEHNVIYYTGTTERRKRLESRGIRLGLHILPLPEDSSALSSNIILQQPCSTDRFLLFVAMVFYYAAMIFMDLQRAKAAQNAEQDSHKEEDIDISEEARSFRPIRINRDEPDSKEGNPQQDNAENPDSNTDGTEKSATNSESSRHVYREAIMTDGILVENIIQEINRLAETGTSDLGAVIFSCENA